MKKKDPKKNSVNKEEVTNITLEPKNPAPANEAPVSAPKRRGRPPKNKTAETPVHNNPAPTDEMPKKRGRHPKTVINDVPVPETAAPVEEPVVKEPTAPIKRNRRLKVVNGEVPVHEGTTPIKRNRRSKVVIDKEPVDPVINTTDNEPVVPINKDDNDKTLVDEAPVPSVPNVEDLAEIAEAFGGEDAVANMEEYLAPDDNWTSEITCRTKTKKGDVLETLTVIPDRVQMRIATDNFMSRQKDRIGLENQIRSTVQGYDNRSENEITILDMFLRDARISEENAKVILETVTMNNPICCWMRKNIGIGPILAAELYAYFDFHRTKYASGFVSYAGLNDNNRPKLSKDQAQRIVDEVIGNKDGNDITDDMLMEIAVRSKWPIEYITRKASKEVKVKAMCKKPSLIKCIETIMESDDMLVDHSEVTSYINELVKNPSATNEHLVEAAAHFGISYNKLFDIAVSKSVKAKLADDGGIRSKDQIRKAISVFPYNRTLKMIIWKMSTSFVYQSNNPNCFYGKLYKQRLQYELEKNEVGDYAEQAERILKSKNFGKNTEAYKAYVQGKLPKAHITARAMRWAAKVFVNHLYEAMWVYYHQSMDYPRYYAIAQMGHRDIIEPAVPYDMLLNANLPEGQRNNNPMPVIK